MADKSTNKESLNLPDDSKPKECPFANDGKHRWWDSRNTHLCHSATDCSHCYINDVMELHRKNIIQGRSSKVFYCKHVVKDTEAEVGYGEFAHKCEITGNRWKNGSYNYHEDYNTYPTRSPCSFCDLPSCDICTFKKEVSHENPHGCCEGCEHRLYCQNSKHKDAGSLTVDAFIAMSKAKLRWGENNGYTVDLSKGVSKKTYSSGCPNYLAYMCTGCESYIKCSCTEEILDSKVFRVFCEKDHEHCPLFKNNTKVEV